MGVGGCRAVESTVCSRNCSRKNCSVDALDGGDSEAQPCEDDIRPAKSLTPEALFERELRQRKQWAKEFGAAPTISTPAVLSQSSAAPLDPKPLSGRDLENVRQRVDGKPFSASAPPVNYEALFQKDLKGVLERSRAEQASAPQATAPAAGQLEAGKQAKGDVQQRMDAKPFLATPPSVNWEALFQKDLKGVLERSQAEQASAPEATAHVGDQLETSKQKKEDVQQRMDAKPFSAAAPPANHEARFQKDLKGFRERSQAEQASSPEAIAHADDQLETGKQTKGDVQQRMDAKPFSAAAPPMSFEAPFQKDLKGVLERSRVERASAPEATAHAGGHLETGKQAKEDVQQRMDAKPFSASAPPVNCEARFHMDLKGVLERSRAEQATSPEATERVDDQLETCKQANEDVQQRMDAKQFSASAPLVKNEALFEKDLKGVLERSRAELASSPEATAHAGDSLETDKQAKGDVQQWMDAKQFSASAPPLNFEALLQKDPKGVLERSQVEQASSPEATAHAGGRLETGEQAKKDVRQRVDAKPFSASAPLVKHEAPFQKDMNGVLELSRTEQASSLETAAHAGNQLETGKQAKDKEQSDESQVTMKSSADFESALLDVAGAVEEVHRAPDGDGR